MTEESLKRGQELKKEISDLEYFIDTLILNGRAKSDNTKIFFDVKTEKSISVFGSRYFGMGTHTKSFKMPNVLMDEFYKISREKLQILKDELESL